MSKRRTSGADYPHVWDSETYAQEGLWRQLYPRVASEIMLEDVYVRLYVDEPDVELLQPPPLAIAKVCVCVCLHGDGDVRAFMLSHRVDDALSRGRRRCELWMRHVSRRAPLLTWQASSCARLHSQLCTWGAS